MFSLRNWVNNLSIKQKLITLSMITSTIAMLIVCGMFILFNIASERNDLVDELSLVGKIFSEELADYIAEDDKKQTIKSISAIKNRRALIQICVYKKGDKNQFAYFINDKKRVISCNKLPPTEKYEFRSSNIVGEYLVVSNKIFNNGEEIGHFTLMANLDRIHERRNRGILTSMLLFCIIISISFFISRSLQTTISKPILELAKISSIVKNGDYTVRAKHFSGDEVGMLTSVYNKMLDEIQFAKEHLEDKVKERTQDLEKVMQIKSQFLSNMSHEIRTPIHGIMNYIDFLEEDWNKLEEDKKYDFIKKLHKNSLRLLSLINNLLDLSKFDAGKMEFCMQKGDMVKIIENVIEECEALYKYNKDISIEFEYKIDTIYNAVFDHERIAQVIRNLLSNSIKFTVKGKILIMLEFTKYRKETGSKINALKVMVSDHGVGIPEHELDLIFGEFNQSAKTKTGAGGTGLGLSISKAIIEAHNGVIWAENNINGFGSTFTFIIPVNSNKPKIAS